MIFLGLQGLTKIFYISWKSFCFQSYQDQIWILYLSPKPLYFYLSLHKSPYTLNILHLLISWRLKLSHFLLISQLIYFFNWLFHSNLIFFSSQFLELLPQYITPNYAKASKSPTGKAFINPCACYKSLGKFETYKEYNFSFLIASIYQFFQL